MLGIAKLPRLGGLTNLVLFVAAASVFFPAANAAAPAITNITSTKTNATYGDGTVIDIEVTFNGPVVVTGSPTIALNVVGGGGGAVTYVSSNANSPANGQTKLTFNYTVAPGDTTSAAHLDCFSASALTLPGGATITYGSGTSISSPIATPQGTSTAGALAKNKTIVVDGVQPTVTKVSSALPSGTYNIGDVIPIDVTFSKKVYVTNPSSLSLGIAASVTTDANYVSGAGTTDLIFNYTVAVGDHSVRLDCSSTSALTLNGGTITDIPATSNNAILTLPALGGRQCVVGCQSDDQQHAVGHQLVTQQRTYSRRQYGHNLWRKLPGCNVGNVQRCVSFVCNFRKFESNQCGASGSCIARRSV